MRTIKFLTVAIAFIFTFGLIKTAQAELVTIFGPVYVAKHKNHHDDEKEAKFMFRAPVPGKGVLIVNNGGDSGKRHKKHRVSSAKIELNDNKVAIQKDFNKKVRELSYEVDLLPLNELEVEVKSCRKCEIEITVLGEAVPQLTPEEILLQRLGRLPQ